MSKRNKIETLHKKVQQTGVEGHTIAVYFLCQVYELSQMIIDATETLLSDRSRKIFIRNLLWLREVGNSLVYQGAIGKTDIKSLIDELVNINIEAPTISKNGAGVAKPVHQEIELGEKLKRQIFRIKSSNNGALLATTIAEICIECKRMVNIFDQIITGEDLSEFTDNLFEIYSCLYEHLLPFHLNDVIDEKGSYFFAGLDSRIICFLEESGNGRG